MSEYCKNCKEMQQRLDAQNAAHRNTVEQLVRLSIAVADCLKTATLCGRGLGSEFRHEAKKADAELREFIAESNVPHEPLPKADTRKDG